MAENRLKTLALDSLVPERRAIKLAVIIPWFICSLGALYYCYEYFLRICPGVMTNELMREYGLTGAQIGGLSAFYYHAYVPMQIMVGLLMDRFGPRRLLTLACLLCAFGTYLFASGYSLAVAETGRFLVGFGSAFAFVGALKLATIWLPPNRFALISGVICCLGMIGAMMGDILLRALVDAIGWQVTIYISAVTGVVLTAILFTFIRDVNPIQTQHTQRLDFRGVLLGLLKALKNPQIWLNGIAGCLLYLSLTAFAELWGITYLEQAQGLSKVHAANANSMVFLGWAIGSPFWGWFSDFVKRRCIPIIWASIGSLASIIILLFVPHLPTAVIYLDLFLFGLLSSVQILVFSIARETTNIKIAGTAIALTNMIVMLGGNLFQPMIGKLLDMNWSGALVDGARVYSPHAFQFSLLSIPIGIAIGIVAMLFVKETRCEIRIEER